MHSSTTSGQVGVNVNPSDLTPDNMKLTTNEVDQAKLPLASTFERTSFDQLLCQYDHKHDLPPTIELTQAFLLTQNMKETATRVSGLTAGGSGYFLKNDYVGDSLRLSDAMQSVSRLLGNLGTSDKASNFLLEQRKLMQAQAKENKHIRDLIEQKIVDGLEYVRIKEKIAQTKSRAKDLLEVEFTSSDEAPEQNLKQHIQYEKPQSNGTQNPEHKVKGDNSQTQEDSEEATKNKLETEKRIKSIVRQLRYDAKEHLSSKNGHSIVNAESLPLEKICYKLRKNQRYIKKRESKAMQKGILSTLEVTSQELQKELRSLEQIQKEQSFNKTQTQLETLINKFQQFNGIEKRLNVDGIEKSISELDSLPLNQVSYEIQNILFDFCGIDNKGKAVTKTKNKRDIFGRILKIPSKSQQLQQYQDPNESSRSQNESTNNVQQQKKKKNNQELVKVIGLEPEHIVQHLDKYKISVNKMPVFSNIFERAEPIIPGIGMTVAGSIIAANQGGQMTFARVDGRNVISLQFNPYEIEDPHKKKVYETAMKDIVDQRSKLQSISKQAKEKQEVSNIKRAWLNILKKDIPKAHRQFQKYKADQEANNKKQSQNCLKEVRKKAIKTQRLAKESNFRAKKLTKEMTNYWKKRDKEMADLKRKKEKVEKELKRKQEEEKEALLQKKRLEFIMQQSEIYAHFMSKKLGLGEEQQKQREIDLDDEQKDRFVRVDIDEYQARNNVASMINENLSRVGQFDQETYNKKFSSSNQVREDELEVDKFDNPDGNFSNIIQAPKCFLGHLKDYQLKGMRWLDNLYEQGINGILADEMGLGKTIQAIALLAHLYENKGVWGPFLIIVPVTTLHNWQNELAKFCPTLKVLPYFGSPEERKKLGRFLDPKNLYNPTMRVNILLTSYNLIVNNQKDQQKLLRVKWHYMILDEAQAIKNNLSRRWKVLLQFQTRNRLLLTGTPIQNSMAELWALLHFIMPRLFDSHEQFQEWFSKDIEQHSFHNQGEINKHQLKRLHLVLKPFMLRRLKKDVESEIGPKVEHEKYCNMTHRQRVLYHRIKSKISTKDLFQLVENKAKMENLMNLVMQFRKVCNHPELFERRIGRIPFSFKELQIGMQPNPAFQSIPDLRVQIKNPINYEIPKLIYDECFLATDNNTKLFRKIRRGVDEPFQEVSIATHLAFFNIFNTYNLYDSIYNSKNSAFSILGLLAKCNNWSLGEVSYLFIADPLIKQIALMHFYHQKYHKNMYLNVLNSESDIIQLKHLQIISQGFDINMQTYINRDYSSSIMFREQKVYNQKGYLEFIEPLVAEDLNDFTKYSRQLKQDLDIFVQASLAENIQYTCRSGTFNRFLTSAINSSLHKKILLGSKFKPKYEILLGRVGRDKSSFLQMSDNFNTAGLPTGYSLIEKGIIDQAITEKGASILELPNYSRLVTDCAKMQYLDKLLAELCRDNHRVLIFCQMTRMLDILEDFLCWKKYTYFRMDGSTSIPDRRYMVEEYQKNPNIFAFLLSTRAGGLGVNLTAADTVVFYDNDWNPTMDAQATDRAHRIGQTKTVSVYRLITKGTVEEKILKRARQKQNVQSTVYGGNALKADVFKPIDVVNMLLDDQEQKDLKQSGQFLKTKRLKKQIKPSSNPFNLNQKINYNDDNEDNDYTQKSEAVASLNQVTQIDKKQSTPLKSSSKKAEDVVPKKPGRKPNPDKQKPQNAVQNIFATSRSLTTAVSGPFSVQKTSSSKKPEESRIEQAAQDENDDEYMDDVNEEDEEEEEEEEADGDFFALLENNGLEIEFNDDENPIPQDIEEDEEGGSKLKPKSKKADEEDCGGEEDEDMADEY